MAESLTGNTIASTYKTLLKAGSNNPVALASGSGDSERLVFGEDDAADVRTAIYVTQDRMGIGTATPETQLEIESATGATFSLSSSEAALTAGDDIGTIFFQGSDSDLSSAPAIGAKILVEADNTWDQTSDNDAPTRIGFYTQDNDQTADALANSRMVIKADGSIGIGTESPISVFEIEDGLTTTGAVLTLGTKEPTVVANDVLGRINFYAPLDTGVDSDAVGASISAVAQDTFSDSVNSTALYFQTGKSEDATGTDASMVIDEDGSVGIGTTSPDYQLEISKDSANAGLTLSSYDNTESTAPTIILRKGEGTEASHASAVDDNCTLGVLSFQGFDSNTFEIGAQILARTAGTPADEDMPTDLEFWTNDGGDDLSKRMTITQDGNVGINIGDPNVGALLHVYDATITATEHYIGMKNEHTKTLGSMDQTKNLTGFSSTIKYNDADQNFNDLKGAYIQANCETNTASDVIIGVQSHGLLTLGNTDYLYGGYSVGQIAAGTIDYNIYGYLMSCNADGGTITGNAYGAYIVTDIDAAVSSVGGSVYGQYLSTAAKKNPSGSGYGMYIDSNQHIDYGLFIDGGAKNLEVRGNNFNDATCVTANTDETVTHDDDDGRIQAGMRVVGSGIPVGTTVAAITSDTEFELSIAASATADPVTLRFSEPASVILSNGLTDVGIGDEIGKINFQTPSEAEGTDAQLVGASIHAEASEAFAADNNSTDLVFSTGTTSAPIERMRIDQDGYVGIGTSDPASEFHIENSGVDRPKLTIRNSSTSQQDGGKLVFQNVDTNTNLGDNLELGEILFQGWNITGTDFESAAKIVCRKDGATTGNNDMGGEIAFYTNPDDLAGGGLQRMTIQANGYVGIGKDIPTSQLHVSRELVDNAVLAHFEYHTSDDAVDADDTIMILEFGDDNSHAGNPYFMQFNDSDSIMAHIQWDDTNSAVFTDASDYRIKSNIEPMDSSLSNINKLKPSSFNIRNAPKKAYGFIAHELAEVYPSMVTGEKDAVDEDGKILAQGVAYSKLIPFMIKAIQELTAKVEALENQ